MLFGMTPNAELRISPSVALERLVEKGQDLPSLPEIYLHVSNQLDDETSTAQQIGESVQHDPALTSRVLKMANSAYYGLPTQVSSVAQSVSLLGRERLRHILIGLLLKGVFSGRNNPAFSMQAFWQHSIKTAIIARQLARKISEIKEPEALFSAGLLHDVGKLLLIDKYPERMLAAEECTIQKRVDTLAAELAHIGVTHATVGEALMVHWGLPQLLIDCARNHHEPVHDGPHRTATHLVYLANNLSKYVSPLDDSETRYILEDIENWDMGYTTLEEIASACQYADDMVFEVMESFGMVELEISSE